GAEGRRLHPVDADLEERRVHLGDEVGSGEHHVLVAALEVRTAEVVWPEILVLYPRSEGAVEDQDAVAQGSEKGRHHGKVTGGGCSIPLRLGHRAGSSARSTRGGARARNRFHRAKQRDLRRWDGR